MWIVLLACSAQIGLVERSCADEVAPTSQPMGQTPGKVTAIKVDAKIVEALLPIESTVNAYRSDTGSEVLTELEPGDAVIPVSTNRAQDSSHRRIVTTTVNGKLVECYVNIRDFRDGFAALSKLRITSSPELGASALALANGKRLVRAVFARDGEPTRLEISADHIRGLSELDEAVTTLSTAQRAESLDSARSYWTQRELIWSKDGKAFYMQEIAPIVRTVARMEDTRCGKCNGRQHPICPACNGAGSQMLGDPRREVVGTRTCSECRGSGLAKATCAACRGKGIVRRKVTSRETQLRLKDPVLLSSDVAPVRALLKKWKTK